MHNNHAQMRTLGFSRDNDGNRIITFALHYSSPQFAPTLFEVLWNNLTGARLLYCCPEVVEFTKQANDITFEFGPTLYDLTFWSYQRQVEIAMGVPWHKPDLCYSVTHNDIAQAYEDSCALMLEVFK